MRSKNSHTNRDPDFNSFKKIACFLVHGSLLLFFITIVLSCVPNSTGKLNGNSVNGNMIDHLAADNYVRDIVNHPAFKNFGELLLPWDDNTGYYNTKLTEVGSLMPYHRNVRTDDVLQAINHLIDEAGNSKIIFYDFYTDQQKQQDPGKKNTGLFFYRGNPNARLP